MAESLIFGKCEIELLQTLVRHRVPFIIIGLSAATLQGVPAVTRDIDLWVEDLGDPRFKKALKAAGVLYVPPLLGHPPRLGGDAVELIDLVTHVDGLDSFAKELKRAVLVPLGRVKVKVLPLERIIASKRAANRPKDRLTLPMLEDVALTLRTRRRRKA